MRGLDSITDSTDKNLSKPWEIMKDRGTWCAAVHGAVKSQTQLSDRTATTDDIYSHQKGPKWPSLWFQFPLNVAAAVKVPLAKQPSLSNRPSVVLALP